MAMMLVLGETAQVKPLLFVLQNKKIIFYSS